MFSRIALVTALALAGITGAAHATPTTNLLTNGGFETGSFSGWTQGGNMSYTTVASGTNAHSGNFYANFGPVGSSGTISQTVSTTAGASYTVSFWLENEAGGAPNSFSASWGTQTLTSLTNIPISSWTFETFTVTGTGTDTLTLAFRDDPSFLQLDDVSVTSRAAVPEPASLGLLGAGLAALGLRRRARV